ncbi:MAG TPA: RHS repeat-associated core domain-containing protein [Polyangiaceae bacterium]
MNSRSLRSARFVRLRSATLLLGRLALGGVTLGDLAVGCGGEKPRSDKDSTVHPAVPAPPVEGACADGIDNDKDGKLDCSDVDCLSPGGECVAAPPLDRTVPTTVAESAAYLYQGDNPLQKGVTKNAIDAQRVAMLRGRTLDATGQPLAAVKLSVKGHPEYGSTYSRGDGAFDMAVNGGSRLVLEYERAGYLPLQRAVQPGWQRYLVVPDAGLVVASTQVTHVTANNAQPQSIVGERHSDEYGDRQPLVVIDANTTVQAQLPDGTAKELDALSVTTTEYPISRDNRYAPGSITLSGGFSFGLEFAVKEATALGADHVAFSQPVSIYVENLADMAVGSRLVLQQYDRQSGQWESAQRGNVIRLLDAKDGAAAVDVDGDGNADSDATLEQLGITASDRSELGHRYRAGQVLWHAEVSHFSGLNLQAQGTLPANALPPVRRGIIAKTLDAPTYRNGAVVEYQASTHAESISGTPFTLHYQSNRTLSYGAGRELEVPLLGDSVPSGLRKIRSRVTVAGRSFEKEFTSLAANLRHSVVWDGTSPSGALLQGQQTAEVSIAYVYADANNAKLEAILPLSFSVPLSNWDARAYAMGGFSIDAQHVFDPAQQIIYFGDGTQRSGNNVSLAAKSANADSDFDLGTPDSLFVSADGSLVVTDDQTGTLNFGRILQLGADGTPKVLFGDGAAGSAVNIQLTQPQGVLVTSDGRIIVSDIWDERIVEISPSGSMRTLVSEYPEDKPEVLFDLNRPDGMALGPHEELYFVDSGRVFRLAAGKLEIIAGGGTETADGGQAVNALLVVPSGLAVDHDGNIFVSERGQENQAGGHRVRKITPSGVITSVAGLGTPGYSGDGDLAATAQLNDPHGLTLDPEGRLYIVDQGNNRIRRVSSDGMIQTVIGGGKGELGENSLALNVKLDAPDGIAAGPDGSLYIAQNHSVVRAFVGMPQLSRTDLLVPSSDGRALYHFDARGRHLETIDALTGVTELTFAYDAKSGLLTSITDKNKQVTTVERDANGNAVAIVAPFGQRTGFKLNSNGDVATITDPLNRATTITWDAARLVGKIESPKSKSVTLSYDPSGRLLNISDATGYQETLTRSEITNGWQVDVTNSAKQKTGYAVQYQPETWTRTTIATDGAKTQFIDAGARMKEKAADGTSREVTFLSHELFGAQVLRPYEDTLTLPSGKSVMTTYTPANHFKATGNPLDLISQTEAAETNGRWYKSVFTKAAGTITQTSPSGRTSEIQLDSLGRPDSLSGAGMPATKWAYDAQGRLDHMTRSAGTDTRQDSVGYDENGWIKWSKNALAQETGYRRDLMGRLWDLERPDGAATHWEPDEADNVKVLTPPNGQAHLFSYWEKSKLLKQVTPPSVSSGTSSGSSGTGSSGTGSSGTLQFDYDDLSDSLSALKKISHADGRSIEFGYDALGRLSSQKLEKATLNFYYTQDHLTRINRSDGVTVDQSFDGPLWTGSKWSGSVSGNVKATYDKNLWLASLTVNDASTVNFTYDDDGLLTAATATAGAVTLTRDSATGNVTGLTVGNVTSQQQISSFGELSRLSTAVSGAALFEQNVVERDALGRIKHLTETAQGTAHDITYEYDLAGRLAQESRDGTATVYSYDPNGNRTSVQVGAAAPIVAAYDAQDRILNAGTQTYSHDAHGDRKSQAVGTKSQEYTYDELGNLMKVVVKDGSTQHVVEYIVDGLGRRVARRIDGNFDKKWLYRDSLRPVAEVDAAGVFTHFIYASHSPLGGAPVAMIRAGVLYRVIQDHIGSVRLVVNAQTGEVAQSIEYDAYGRVLSETGTGFQPFGFAGGLYDAVTGLVRFGARDYDAETGRWTNRDPIGFGGQQGNKYLYVGGEPVNGFDPDGEHPVVLVIVAGVSVLLATSDREAYTTAALSMLGAAVGPVLGFVAKAFKGAGAAGSTATRVTQFYNPAAGSFGAGAARALESATPSNVITRMLEGPTAGSWVAPQAASNMNWFSRMMTGRGGLRNYVEFSVSPGELVNPGGFKSLYSPWQQMVPGGVDLTGRGAVFGQLGPNYGMYLFFGGVGAGGAGIIYYGTTID